MLGEFQFNPVAPEPEPKPAEPPADLVAWREIAESQDPADFEAFLTTFPASVLATAARDRLALLNDPAAELEAWKALDGSRDIPAYEAFLRRYPRGPYSAAASLTLQDLLWMQLSASDDRAGMEAFLARFPSGPFATLARFTLENLQAAPDPARTALPPAAAAPGEGQAGLTTPAAPAPVDTPAQDDAAAQPKPPRALSLVEPARDEPAKTAALARTGEIEPNLIQIALRALGYYKGRIDGVFGPASRRAVALFQEQSGFPITGDLLPGEIVELIAAAAESGDTDSQNTYGIMFAKGAGVVQDRVAAAKWFRLAAEAGNTFAQTNLGLLSEGGLAGSADTE